MIRVFFKEDIYIYIYILVIHIYNQSSIEKDIVAIMLALNQ